MDLSFCKGSRPILVISILNLISRQKREFGRNLTNQINNSANISQFKLTESFVFGPVDEKKVYINRSRKLPTFSSNSDSKKTFIIQENPREEEEEMMRIPATPRTPSRCYPTNNFFERRRSLPSVIPTTSNSFIRRTIVYVQKCILFNYPFSEAAT